MQKKPCMEKEIIWYQGNREINVLEGDQNQQLKENKWWLTCEISNW